MTTFNEISFMQIHRENIHAVGGVPRFRITAIGSRQVEVLAREGGEGDCYDLYARGAQTSRARRHGFQI